MVSMNSQQQEAVYSNSDRILVLAGAGTGKTFVMINRIKRLVDEGVDPPSILALTFTNAAAFEMGERFRRLQEFDSCISIPEFRTFHSFCYSLIAKDRDIRKHLGYLQVPSIIDEPTMKRIQSEVKHSCKIKLSDKLISDPSNLNPKQQYEYDLYYKALDRRIKQDSVITFDMLAKFVCNLFIEDNPIVQKYVDRYKYIFIDEFQDTDPLQWSFAKCFKDSSIFIVGDALQSIYGFRNADSSIIKSLAYDKDWTVIKLFENYRSTEEIVATANHNSRYAEDKYRVSLHAQTSGPPVQFKQDLRCDRRSPYPDSIKSQVASFCTEHDGTSAILLRTNAEVSEIDNYLTDNKIDHSLGKPNTDAIHILNGVTDSSYLINWCATHLNSDNYIDFLRIESIESKEEDTAVDRLNRFINHFGNNAKIAEYMNKAFKIREILLSKELTQLKCHDILELLDIKDVIVDTDAGNPVEILGYLKSVVTQKKDSELYVGTIHSSKGLEYNNVVLLGVDGPSFRLSNEENKNLYYVGITRARTNLMVIKA